jgi:Mn2+/Fe2+ NRAMP family transporter
MIQVARRSPKPTSKSEKRIRSLVAHPARLLRFLGPGLVTGAADDVPTGIATNTQSGAQFGFVMLWTVVLSYPLMAAIQEASAWIARVSGAGLARTFGFIIRRGSTITLAFRLRHNHRFHYTSALPKSSD